MDLSRDGDRSSMLGASCMTFLPNVYTWMETHTQGTTSLNDKTVQGTSLNEYIHFTQISMHPKHMCFDRLEIRPCHM